MINWPTNRNPKSNPFVLTSTDLGPMLVNRFDFRQVDNGVIGVGYNLLQNSAFDANESNIMIQVLALLRQYRGDGVVMFDGGANIGAYTLAAARAMFGWGNVIAVEAQERLYYALAGNIVLNNLSNARAIWAALSDKKGTLEIPEPDYYQPASYGSLELIQTETSEFIGQKLVKTQEVNAITIDSLKLDRLDYLKIDVEHMEEIVLAGAKKTIKTLKPVIQIEVLKSDREKIREFIEKAGYTILDMNQGYDYLCIPTGDPLLNHLKPA
jgi:FkbM family methyltransferase